jgi:glycosyltransferase involved in cell wall biosynthesis
MHLYRWYQRNILKFTRLVSLVAMEKGTMPKQTSSHNHRRRPIHVMFFSEAPAFGGAEQYLVTLMNLLPRDEFRLSCVCTNQRTLATIQQRVSAPEEIDFAFFRTGTKPAAWKIVWPLACLFASRNLDIVHYNGLEGSGAIGVVVAASMVGIPHIIGTVHTTGGRRSSSLLRRMLLWLSDTLVHQVILVCRRSMQQVYEHRYLTPKKLSIIYYGITIPPASEVQRHRDSPDRPVVIGTVGQLIPRKGIDMLLEAASRLQYLDTVQFKIIGDGPERHHLETLVRQLGINERVEFTGWQNDVNSALRSLDMFVLFSFSEALPFAILEAMASGLPIIATSVGGVVEAVIDGQTGLLVEPGDVAGLVHALQTLIDDPGMRRAMGQAGRQRAVEYFSDEQMAEQTRQYYHRLANEPE